MAGEPIRETLVSPFQFPIAKRNFSHQDAQRLFEALAGMLTMHDEIGVKMTPQGAEFTVIDASADAPLVPRALLVQLDGVTNVR
jgi:hypothetical protein